MASSFFLFAGCSVVIHEAEITLINIRLFLSVSLCQSDRPLKCIIMWPSNVSGTSNDC